MTLEQIKEELGLENLDLYKSLDQEGKFTGWYKMWDEITRMQICIHKNTVEAIKSNSEIDNLELEIEERISPSTQKPYTNKSIIIDTRINDSDITKYPKLILPNQYKKYDSYEKHLFFDLWAEKELPLKPVFEPQAKKNIIKDIIWFSTILVMISIVVFLLVLYIDYVNNFFAKGFIIISYLLILRWLFNSFIGKNIGSIKREEELFLQEMEKYKTECKEIQESNQRLQILKKEILENIDNYKKEKKTEVLKSYKEPTTVNHLDNKNRVGASEKMFATYLLKYFHSLVSIDECLFFSDNHTSGTVYPDFIIKCEQFILAVEIDEPYSIADQKPIHFLTKWTHPTTLCIHDSTVDEKNEYYYKENNWCVVRFTENQIANNPVACCKYIADIMCKLTDIEHITHFPILKIDNLKNTKALIEEKAWTEQEAYTLIEQKYRDTALQKIKKIRINFLIFILITKEPEEDEVLLYSKYTNPNIVIANKKDLKSCGEKGIPFNFNIEEFSLLSSTILRKDSAGKFEDLHVYRLDKKTIL